MIDSMESRPEPSKRRPGRRDRRDVYLVIVMMIIMIMMMMMMTTIMMMTKMIMMTKMMMITMMMIIIYDAGCLDRR